MCTHVRDITRTVDSPTSNCGQSFIDVVSSERHLDDSHSGNAPLVRRTIEENYVSGSQSVRIRVAEVRFPECVAPWLRLCVPNPRKLELCILASARPVGKELVVPAWLDRDGPDWLT